MELIHKYADFWRKQVTVSRIIGLLLLFIGFQFLLGYMSALIKAESGGMGVLDLGFGYSAESVYTQYLDHFTQEGIRIYKIAWWIDLVYPLVYSLLLCFIISWGFRFALPPQSPLWIVNLIPFLSADFDYLENIGVISLLCSFPEKWIFMALWTSIFGVLKWITAAVAIAIALVALPIGFFYKN